MSGMDIDSPSTPSTVSTPCPTVWSLPTPRPQPKSSDALFLGHIIKQKTRRFQVVSKTATKREPSWIWQHGAELKQLGVAPKKKPDWLCTPCWNKGITTIFHASSTTAGIEHLRDVHQLNSDGAIPGLGVSNTPEVIQMQRDGAV